MMGGLPSELARWADRIRGYAEEFGLDFPEVRFHLLDWKGINEVASYGGFPTRYPHWSYGMEYERMSKSYAYGLHRIYEMVINTDPCHAYLLASNNLIDQKLVMAHVYGHADFFKNNLWFAHTNRRMLDEMANHATRIYRYIERYGYEAVENLIDIGLSIDNLIDIHAPAIRRQPRPPDPALEGEPKTVKRIPSKEYMDTFINPPDFLAAQKKRLEDETKQARRFPAASERDVMLFLVNHAPLETWEADVLDMLREEAYYFAPQGQTKILNEGWACLAAGSLVLTEHGLLPIDKLVTERRATRVGDGETLRAVYDWARFEQRDTVWVRTKRGLELEGSVTHQVLLADGSWRRLDEVKPGDRVQMSQPQDLWASEYVTLDWQPHHRLTLSQVAVESGVNLSTVIRHRQGRPGRHGDVLAPLVAEYDADVAAVGYTQDRRARARIPAVVDEKLGAFLGYLIGDGHISEVKRVIGLTTGDEEQADHFAALVYDLFGLTARKKWDDGRWRVLFSSQDVTEFLKHLGLKTGPAARDKALPDVVLRSPKSVVAACLRAYFDCDGHAGKTGVILSTTSQALSQVTQLLLLNCGIRSSRQLQRDGCWHVRIFGQSAAQFQQSIGFGLTRKQQALAEYLTAHRWFKREEWTDEVVALERRRGAVYDISVEETHRYAAQGFINHNSYWHSTIMTRRVLSDAEVIDYADHHSGTVAMHSGQLNPYKLGLELLRDIEERWDKGRFGREYEQCDDRTRKAAWDLKLGLGREKIFEVRRIYNDIGFVDQFLTEDFCERYKLFTYRWNPRTERYEIASRDFAAIKRQLLQSLTNFGQPIIAVEDGNYANRGELYLRHQHEGVDLKLDYARDTLANLYAVWRRPVHLETSLEGKGRTMLTFDGQAHIQKRLD